MPFERPNLPNVITIIRILACPVIFVLILSPEVNHLFLAWAIFVVAAVSDLWDGYLARKHGWVTDTGKLLDPLADKLLLVSTFLPFYLLSLRSDPMTDVPWWGPFPLWVLIVIFGRELLVTIFRTWAARRGSVLSAGPSGKIKAFVQNFFSGSLILWYALSRAARERGWEGATAWELWEHLHRAVVGLGLALALFLTVYSLGVYYWQNRRLLHSGPGVSR